MGWILLAWLLGCAATSAVLWRRTRPVLALAITGAAAVALPIDALAVLIVLPWVIVRRPARTAWWCGALTAAATVASLAKDAARRPDHSVLSVTNQETGQLSNLPTWGYLVLGLLLLAASAGWGLLRRLQEHAEAAERARVEQAQQVAHLRVEQARQVEQLQAELTTELTRQDERDLIARELHDTVAHHLSVVSLRAAALEVSGDEPEVHEAARSVRAGAHQAMEEMRDLITVLRDAQTPLTAGPGPGRTLADLADLVATARDGGADISANVFVTDGAAAPPALTRAVYRIVQEALTNALKHAPGARVDLDVRAAPGDGVHLRVRNPLQAGAPAAPGSGTGLIGVRERVDSVGGTVQAGPDGDRWVLVAHLPWPTAPTTPAAPAAAP